MLDSLATNFLILFLVLLPFIILELLNISYKFRLFASVLFLLESLSMILLPKTNMVMVRTFLFMFSLSYIFYISNKSNSKIIQKGESTLLNWFFRNLFSQKYLVYLGTIIATLIMYFNIFVFEPNTSTQGTETVFGIKDQILLFFCIVCIGFTHIPNSYNTERDFTFIFSLCLLLLFIFLPLLLDILENLGFIEDYGTSLRTLFLTKPLSSLLNITGFQAVTDGNFLFFKLTGGETVHLFVAARCSGLYSMIIFVSALIGYFVAIENRVDYNFAIFLLIGLFFAYLANLIRMYVIVVIGYYYGLEALDWAHANIGWIIFFFWIGVFWKMLIWIIPPNKLEIRYE